VQGNRLPGPERVFRLESEANLRERMRQEALQDQRALPRFPAETKLTEPPPARPTTPKDLLVEPNYVYYRRLMFEQKSSERYGWDLGPLQPLVSSGVFGADFFTAGVRRLAEPCRIWEASPGYCLPGDPVPCMFYWPVPTYWPVYGVSLKMPLLGFEMTISQGTPGDGVDWQGGGR
jgi:hypothetical protein